MAEMPRPVKVTLVADVRVYLRGIRRARRTCRALRYRRWWGEHGHLLAACLVIGLAAGVNAGILIAVAAR